MLASKHHRRRHLNRTSMVSIKTSAQREVRRLSSYEQRKVWRIGFLLALLGIPAGLIYSAKLTLLNANRLGRHCSEVNVSSPSRGFSFGIVSCSDDMNTVPSRSFQGMMQLVSPNKVSYAQKHGYSFIDASDVLDPGRPPSWSKIRAVQKHMGSYDWIFWNDADSLVTNFEVTLEGLLKSMLGEMKLEDMPEFIITEDVTGVNAGMFFVRDTAWSRDFLNRWWNQTFFIKPFGESKSGDNDALKFMLKTMSLEEKQRHVHIARMQCTFNSYLWIPSWKNVHRLITLSRKVWQGAYSTGDFMVHLAGVDDKKYWIRKFLRESQSRELPTLRSIL